jgi:hypothetical protein
MIRFEHVKIRLNGSISLLWEQKQNYKILNDEFDSRDQICLFTGRMEPTYQSKKSFGLQPKALDEVAARSIADVRSASSAPHWIKSSPSQTFAAHMAVVSYGTHSGCRKADLMQMNYDASSRGREHQVDCSASYGLEVNYCERNSIPLPETNRSWEGRGLNAAFSQDVAVKNSAGHIISSKTEPQASHLPDKIRFYRLAPQPHCSCLER